MYCKSCGELLKDGSKFCGKCGATVEVTAWVGIHCPTCDTLNRPGARFCRQDGTPLAGQSTSVEVPPRVRPVRMEPPPASSVPPPRSAQPLRPIQVDAAEESSSGGPSWRLWLAIGALAAVAALGGGYWFYAHEGAELQVAGTSQTPATPSIAVPPANELKSNVPEVRSAGPPNEAPAPAQSQVAEAPRVSVGDRWVTEVVDHQDAKLNYRAERTVTDVGPDRIITSVRTLGKDYVRSIEYSGQWALIATHLQSGATTTYSPALPYLRFPLQPGRTWQARVVETDAEGKQRVHEVRAKMESWETVQVPAGTFNALKIVSDQRTAFFSTDRA